MIAAIRDLSGKLIDRMLRGFIRAAHCSHPPSLDLFQGVPTVAEERTKVVLCARPAASLQGKRLFYVGSSPKRLTNSQGMLACEAQLY